MTKGEIKEARWHKDRKGEEIAGGEIEKQAYVLA